MDSPPAYEESIFTIETQKANTVTDNPIYDTAADPMKKGGPWFSRRLCCAVVVVIAIIIASCTVSGLSVFYSTQQTDKQPIIICPYVEGNTTSSISFNSPIVKQFDNVDHVSITYSQDTGKVIGIFPASVSPHVLHSLDDNLNVIIAVASDGTKSAECSFTYVHIPDKQPIIICPYVEGNTTSSISFNSPIVKQFDNVDHVSITYSQDTGKVIGIFPASVSPHVLHSLDDNLNVIIAVASDGTKSAECSFTYVHIPDSGCLHLDEQPLSMEDVALIFGSHSRLTPYGPRWVGNLRSQGPLPTGHFATNQIKTEKASPMRLMPYSCQMSSDGIVYDAYTLDRWSVDERSDEMLQQTPAKVGEPWEKVISLGTNMRQLTGGPDGSPKAVFEGKAGIQVGIQGSGDPEMTSFGEIYANFIWRSGSSTMEAPLVRGSPLLTHIFSNANPVLKPYCLSAVNGQSASYECPVERDASDRGSGFLEGSCSDGTLTITLRNTKAVELTNVQWAAKDLVEWQNQHGVMTTCHSGVCSQSADGKTVTIRVPGSATMAFAVNVIYGYVLPSDWIANPEVAPCVVVKRSVDSMAMEDDKSRQRRAPPDITHSIECDKARNLQIVLQHADPFTSINQVQFAVRSAGSWARYRQMITCSPYTCSLSSDKRTLTYTSTAPAIDIKYAYNIIGVIVMPPGNWINNPYEYTCGGTGITDDRFVFELDEPGYKLPGQTRKFVAYFSEVMTLTVQPNGAFFSPAAGGAFTGTMQLAYVGSTTRGDLSAARYMDQYAGVYSYRPKTSYCVKDNTGYISFDWNKRNANMTGGWNPAQNLLMTVMPHQEVLLQSSCTLINTPYGFYGYIGDSWLMEEPLPPATMLPDSKAVNDIKLDPSKLQDILDGLEKDTNQHNLDDICANSNSYEVGKEIAKVARAASISRAFDTTHYKLLDPSIEKCLDMWLNIKSGLGVENQFDYDNVWGGLFISGVKEGQPLDPHANFGFSLYSDHHFHLGYFLYTLGYYAYYYPQWVNTGDTRSRIYAIARDIGNPSALDPYFPTVRHKDWFMGMSWATGVIGGARQAESSTQAIACYHGLAALGWALGDVTMQHIGQITLATEIRSVRHYWHVRSNNRHIFPSYIQDYGTIGHFAEDAIFYYTLNWPCDPVEFPMRHACLVGIQVIPITSISYTYMDQEWAASVKNVCEWSNDPWSAPGADLIDQTILKPVNKGYGAFCHAAMAMYDSSTQTRAANFIKGMQSNELVGGTGIASTLLFIYGQT